MGTENKEMNKPDSKIGPEARSGGPSSYPAESALPERLLRPMEVATMLACSRAKVYDALARGELPCVRLGRSPRVPLRALEEWIQARTHGGALSNDEPAELQVRRRP